MKISGPRGPHLDGIEKSAERKKPTEKPADVSFAEALHPAEPTAGADQATSLAAELAARLQMGELSSGQAVREVVEQIVQKRGALLPPQAQHRLRESLERMLVEDPRLAGYMKKLQGAER